MLKVVGGEKAAPEVRGVKGLEDFFRAVGEAAVAQQQAEPAQGKILVMRGHDSVGSECRGSAVAVAAPGVARDIDAEFHRPVIFSEAERLVAAVAPAHAAKDAHLRRDGLLEVQAESVFVPPLLARGNDVRCRGLTVEKLRNRLAVVSHVGVVQIGD